MELLDDPPAGAEVVRFASAEDVWEHSFRAFGFPNGHDDGVWATGRLLGKQANNWIQIEDVKTEGFAVMPGFSGGPVWDTLLHGVVGMVVASSRRADTKTAFVIPLDVLVAAWPLIEPVTCPRVFLSAAPADATFAERLRIDLEAHGIVVWDGQTDLADTTMDAQMRVQQAIRAAQAVMLVASRQTRPSRQVKEHLRLADLYQRRLILVWVDKDEGAQPLLASWRDTVLVDARTTPYEATLAAIEAALRQSRSLSGLLSPPVAPPAYEPRNPYKGLHAFTEQDTRDFFGREILSNELATTVETLLMREQKEGQSARLLAVIGPSGSGKSSAVMAGLLPCLRTGRVFNSKEWTYLDPMFPGSQPLEALAVILARQFPVRSVLSLHNDLTSDSVRALHLLAAQFVPEAQSKVVLVVDQFEELFTPTTSEEERKHFLDLLVTAVTEPRGPVLVILTLRADFYERLMQYPELYRLIEAHHVSILPMETEELRSAVEYPAALPDVQLTFEGSLVGDLLFEIQGQAGALPLLQFTLDQLFERREGHRLTLQAYHEMGGVKGALSHHAEKTYQELPSEEHRTLARTLFLRLIDPGMTEQETTRRRAALSEFDLLDAEQTRHMHETLDRFVKARLLTANQLGGRTTLEVSHEAVIREWPRLGGWLREARDDIRLQQMINEDTAEWVRRSKPTDRLYRGSQLTEAQEWEQRNMPSQDEAAFLQASMAEEERNKRQEQAQQLRELSLQRHVVSRQRLLLAAVSSGLILALILSIVSFSQYQRAQTETVVAQNNAATAEARALLAQARALAANANYYLAKNQLDRALLLDVKSTAIASTYETRNSLLNSLLAHPQITTLLRMPARIYPINSLAFNSSGSFLVSSDDDDVYIWDMKTKEGHSLLSLVETGHYVSHLALSPDGRLLVTAGSGGTWLYDVQTKAQLAQLEGTTPNRDWGNFAGLPLTFSHSGKILAAGRCQVYLSSSNGSSRCARTRISLWDPLAKKRLLPFFTITTGEVNSLAFSQDDTILAAGSDDGLVRLWNVTTGDQLTTPLPVSTQPISSVAFNANGNTLAVGSTDGTVSLWDSTTGKHIRSLMASNTHSIFSVAFSPNGKILAAGSDDGLIRLWHMTTGNTLGAPLIAAPEGVQSLAFSPDGQTLVSGTRGTIAVWNLEANTPISLRIKYNATLCCVAFSPDGTTAAVASTDGIILLWNLAQKRLQDRLNATIPGSTNNPSAIISLDWSQQNILAAGRQDGKIQLWDMKRKTPLLNFVHPQSLSKILFSPDGRFLASIGEPTKQGNQLMLWSIEKRVALYAFSVPPDSEAFPFPPALTFSPNGDLLASGWCSEVDQFQSCDKSEIFLWNTITGKLRSVPSSNMLTDLAFSPDGHLLASTDADTITFFDTTSWKPKGDPLSFHSLVNIPTNSSGIGGYSTHIAFSRDGQMLLSYGLAENGSLFILWDLKRGEPFADAIQTDSNLSDLKLSPNRQYLLSAGWLQPGGGETTLWNLDMTVWQQQACAIANRNFTQEEIDLFFRDQPYSNVCPHLPMDSSVIQALLDKAHKAIQQGHRQEAKAYYKQLTAAAIATEDADGSSAVCADGTIHQQINDVLPACDYLVKRDPGNIGYRVWRGLARSLRGDHTGATADFQQVTQQSLKSEDADLNNRVCWYGSLAQEAKIVLPACDYGIHLDPGNVAIYDSRGLARALSGDIQGAIADYTFVLDPSHGYGSLYPDQVRERQAWLTALKAGHNPFDTKTLLQLLQE